ncbi:MAG TPA: inner membrane-spanning protein YciB [Steroidobacteraceae bacterium]|nr:inner membrane-spanning protein YciB [Steroidobacteraceae bacterium]
MNPLLEWLPLLLFFTAFKLYGIYIGTAALMIGCVALMLAHRVRTGRYKTLHVLTAAVALILGAATLLLHDKRFIQWKPTVLFGLAACAFLGSSLFGRQPLARRVLEGIYPERLAVAARTWLLINALWGAWFAFLAALNIYVARHFSDAVWVNFKVFGLTLAMMLFLVPQVFWLYGKSKAAAAEQS